MLSMLAFMNLLIVHFIADFVMQTDDQARNKWNDNVALIEHVSVYTACLLIVSLVMFGRIGLIFGLVNGVLHFVTDYFTSKRSHYWFITMKDTHNGFVVVGFDQLIHALTLGVSVLALFYWWWA